MTDIKIQTPDWNFLLVTMKSIRALPVSVLLIFVFISSVRSFDQSYYKNAYNHNKYNYLKGNNNNKYSNFNSNQDSYRSDKSDLIFPGKWSSVLFFYLFWLDNASNFQKGWIPHKTLNSAYTI